MKFLHYHRNAYTLYRKKVGNLLFTATGILLVFQFITPVLTDASPTFNEYPITSTEYAPSYIVTGSDGAMWYRENPTGSGTDQIGRVTTSGTVSDYNVTPSGAVAAAVYSLTNGPSGDIWFTSCIYTSSSYYPAVGYITPSSGAVTLAYTGSLGASCNFSAGITTGSDGNLYIGYGTYIEQVTPSGVMSLAYGMAPSGSRFTSLTNGPDGNIWFVNQTQNEIGVMNISTDAVTTYSIPTSSSDLSNITSGPDGNLWFTETQGNNIGKITTSGTITEYAVPTSGAGPDGIASGPDGALWFAESNNNGAIGRITTSGSVTEYLTPTSYSGPMGITAGPDDALWFTETGVNQIGRIGY
jgi:streptogramin lyase